MRKEKDEKTNSLWAGDTRGEYDGMSPEEKSDYLEGKIDILKRNSIEKERVWQRESERVREERVKTSEKIEQMKREIARMREEIREGRSENRMSKRMKEEKENSVQNIQNVQSMQKVDSMQNDEALRRTEIDSRIIVEDVQNSSKVHNSSLPIEWILSRFKGEIVFGLSDLSPEKLKIFGRFFKREFDSLYNKKEVLAGIEASEKSTKNLIKSLLYLSDRPEVISHLLPYVFMKHIVPDGKLYIKEIVHILYKVGVAIFLLSNDTIEDIKNFFTECKDSEELLYLVETLSAKTPLAISRLISEEYIISISEKYPSTARRIVRMLDGCGAYSGSPEAYIAIYSAPDSGPYESPCGEYSFYL